MRPVWMYIYGRGTILVLGPFLRCSKLLGLANTDFYPNSIVCALDFYPSGVIYTSLSWFLRCA
jgi:hypothetical protein